MRSLIGVAQVCGRCEKGDPVVRRARKATGLFFGGGRVTEQRRALGRLRLRKE